MRDFQTLGASLDAAALNVKQALACSTTAPTEGFGVKLVFSNPATVAAGKNPNAAVHPGMQPLMEAMADILRTEVIDYADLMRRAVERLAGRIEGDVEMFGAMLNAARAGVGLDPLISAEGDVAEQIEAAVKDRLEVYAAGEEQRIMDRARAIAEAERGRASTVRPGGTGAVMTGLGAPEAPMGPPGEPPPPRGAPARRGNGR